MLCHTGFTIDLWTQFIGPEFYNDPDCVRWHEYDSNSDGLAAVGDHNNPVVVFLAGTTVNDVRREIADFIIIDSEGSVTLLTDGATDTEGTTTRSLEILQSGGFWLAMFLGVCGVLLLGMQTWGADQLTSHNVALTFPATFVKGVVAASATSLSVILGDQLYRPASAPSKAWKVVLRVINMLTFAAVTGLFVNLLSSASVKFQIDTFSDTAGFRIGTVAGNTPETFMSRNYPAAQLISYNSLDEMEAGFVSGDVSALAYDTTYLVYLFNNNVKSGSRIIEERVNPYAVGIAYEQEATNATRTKMRDGLLAAIGSGTMNALQNRYLRTSEEAAASGSGGTATVLTIILWLGIVAPAMLGAVFFVNLKRLRKLTKGKVVVGLPALLWHRLRFDKTWKERRTAWMTEEECKAEDVRVETSFESLEAVGPATLNGVKQLRHMVRKLLPDSERRPSDASMVMAPATPSSPARGAASFTITPGQGARVAPEAAAASTLPAGEGTCTLTVGTARNLPDGGDGGRQGWMEWRGVPKQFFPVGGGASSEVNFGGAAMVIPVTAGEAASGAVKFVITAGDAATVLYTATVPMNLFTASPGPMMAVPADGGAPGTLDVGGTYAGVPGM